MLLSLNLLSLMGEANENKDVYEELLNILYNNKEMLKFFLCEDIDDDNPDKSLMTLIQVHFS